VCVSVVIPVLNEAATLPTLLDDMSRLAAEVIFVDGGSNDATTDLLEASGFRWFSAPRGRAQQMNAGAAAATGNVLMFLHADTKLPFDAMQRVRAAVRGNAVGGSFALRLDSSRPLLRLVGTMITLRSRLTGVATGDIDFSRRLKRAGPVAQLPATVVTSARRWERGGWLRTTLRMWLLKTAYYCGVDPTLLAPHYQAAR